jgi:predicted nucleic acid-binding protein
LLIIDEKKARQIAKDMELKITGTLGILIEAKLRGKIKTIKPILDTMLDSGFRISDIVYKDILRKTNELN